MKQKNYEFRLNSSPTPRDLDEALSAIYALTVSGSKNYESQCPVGYEELGSYVFNRVLKMLSDWSLKEGVKKDGSWQDGMTLWLSDPTWKTVPSYIRRMLSSGFIDYTRSFYSEFKHIPTDTQESLYVFDRPVADSSNVSIGDVELAFTKLSTEERKSIYKKFELDKASFSEELS